MAEKSKKKGSGQGAAKKADADEAHEPKKAEEKSEKSEKSEKAEAARAKDEPEHHEKAEHHDHHEGGHGDAEGHSAHGHKPNIREYLVIFVILGVLTAIEVGVTKVPGINHTLMALALVSLALTKAAIVGLYYMHLKHETQVLKLTVALPVAAPMVYALVLMSEAAWRLAR